MACFRSAPAVMAHFLQPLGEAALALTLRNVFGPEDRVAFETAARALIGQRGRIRVLILLDSTFTGISQAPAMGDISFYAEHADDIERMAVIGEPQWESHAGLFLGRGARATTIRYFPLSQFGLAQAWLLD